MTVTMRKVSLARAAYALFFFSGSVLLVSLYNNDDHSKETVEITETFQHECKVMWPKSSNLFRDESRVIRKNLRPCLPTIWNKSRPVTVEEKWFPAMLLERQHPELWDGGSWRPSTCRPLQSVAVLVTYRDRPRHLRIMLHHMHPFLQRQNISYTIFIVEQTHSTLFNKGMLYNIGFKEVLETGDYDCIVLQDLDLLPEDDRIPYTCTNRPRHMMEARSKDNYRQIYAGNAGGVLSILPKHYKAINGFSNLYFGWGREDYDFGERLTSSNLTLLRIPPDVGRYKSVRHEHPAEGDMRMKDKLIKSAEARRFKDGLNSLSQGDMYDIVCRERTKLFTWILVDIHKP